MLFCLQAEGLCSFTVFIQDVLPKLAVLILTLVDFLSEFGLQFKLFLKLLLLQSFLVSLRLLNPAQDFDLLLQVLHQLLW